jgi:hypothetical protein
MKASEVFDSCHGRYRNLREWLAESTGQIRALDPESQYDGYHWRPVQARAAEFVADYERIGRKSAASTGVEGAVEAFRDLFCTFGGVQARDFAGGRGGEYLRLLARRSEACAGARVFADGIVSAVALFPRARVDVHDQRTRSFCFLASRRHRT